jgi:NTE family protein
MEIGVALGGGGARGLTHIGVLRVLEREGFRLRAIAGTSMGGVIAAAYAAGFTPDEIEKRISRTAMSELLRSRPDGPSLIGLGRVQQFLREELSSRTFADLRIPLAVTAVDLTAGKEIVLTDGPLVEAVMATIAIPGIFPPQIMGEHRLVDGGMMDPVPVRAARALFRGPIVAVVLSPPPDLWAERRSPSPLRLKIPLMDMVTRLRPGQALNVFIQALELSGRTMTELRLEVDRPDLVIRPECSHVGLFDDTPPADAAALGEQAAEAALPELRALFSPARRLQRRLGLGTRG